MSGLLVAGALEALDLFLEPGDGCLNLLDGKRFQDLADLVILRRARTVIVKYHGFSSMPGAWRLYRSLQRL